MNASEVGKEKETSKGVDGGDEAVFREGPDHSGSCILCSRFYVRSSSKILKIFQGGAI